MKGREKAPLSPDWGQVSTGLRLSPSAEGALMDFFLVPKTSWKEEDKLSGVARGERQADYNFVRRAASHEKKDVYRRKKVAV